MFFLDTASQCSIYSFVLIFQKQWNSSNTQYAHFTSGSMLLQTSLEILQSGRLVWAIVSTGARCSQSPSRGNQAVKLNPENKCPSKVHSNLTGLFLHTLLSCLTTYHQRSVYKNDRKLSNILYCPDFKLEQSSNYHIYYITDFTLHNDLF